MAVGRVPGRATTDGVHTSPPIRAQENLISSATSIRFRTVPITSSPFVMQTFPNNRRSGRAEKRNIALERYGSFRLTVVAYPEWFTLLSNMSLSRVD